MKNAIAIHSLSYSYGNFNVLSKISFKVEQGIFFTVIGPNGSGKSTLMKILAGILKFKKGKISIAGKSIKKYSGRELARHVAYVPQTVSAEFPFTVEELVLLGRSPHQGMLGINSEKDHLIADQAMEFTDTRSLSKKKIDRISGGERQRVFIARAVCQQPEIMLLDEPASALDLAHQVRLMDLLERLKNETGITIIMISHDINLAAMYSDAMILIKNGCVVKQGTAEEVIKPSILDDIFECSFLVDRNPAGNCPRISPIPEKFKLKFPFSHSNFK